MAIIISGKELSKRKKIVLKSQVDLLSRQYGRNPHLAVILVGEDVGSMSYVKGKEKACQEVGILNTTIYKPSNIEEEELLNIIYDLNKNPMVDGILIQLPLPKHIHAQRVIQAISKDKDVDGFHYENVASLYLKQEGILPCTPKGIIEILDSIECQIAGKHAVVIGRSNIVGLPISKLLLDRNATVTICHSQTKNLSSITKEADILIVAVGKALFVTANMIKEGAVVIDVGINRDLTTNKICGDVCFAEVEQKASYITKVPGGVGPMTILCLLENTVDCYLKHVKE